MPKPRRPLTMQFSEFVPTTNLSEDVVRKMRAATGDRVKIESESREQIKRLLQQYEYVKKYERAGPNEPRRADLRKLAASLDEALRLAKAFNQEPPRLWAGIATEADDYMFGQDLNESTLGRLATAARKLSNDIETKRKRRTADQWLKQLLFELETEFRRGGGQHTGVTNKNGERGGRFVRFANEALKAAPC